MPREGDNRPTEAENTERGKKSLLLRLSPAMWNEIAAWASEDFRSVNGQIEYLLSEALKRRRREQ